MSIEKSSSDLSTIATPPARGRHRWPMILGRFACGIVALALLSGCSTFGKKSTTPAAGAKYKPVQKDPNAPKTCSEWMKQTKQIPLNE
jgi:hypothetical protein